MESIIAKTTSRWVDWGCAFWLALLVTGCTSEYTPTYTPEVERAQQNFDKATAVRVVEEALREHWQTISAHVDEDSLFHRFQNATMGDRSAPQEGSCSFRWNEVARASVRTPDALGIMEKWCVVAYGQNGKQLGLIPCSSEQHALDVFAAVEALRR